MKKIKLILGLLAVMLFVQFSSVEASATEAADVEMTDVEVVDMETSDVEAFEAPEDAEEELAVQEVDADHLLIQEGGDEILLKEPVNPRARAITGIERAMDDIIKAMRNRASKQDISAYNVTVDEANSIYAIILNYYPEFFYVDGMMMHYNTSTGYVQYVTLTYQYDKSYSDRYYAALDRAYNEALTDPANMTDLQKARAFHDYICQHTEYDLTLTKYNAYNALVERTAVCQGYSLLYAALLQKAGIDYDFVTSRSMNHMWNLVYNGGYWYHVDTTWDDPVTAEEYNKSYLVDAVGNANHQHFMVSDAKIQSLNHYGYTSPYTCSNKNLDNAYWQSDVSAIFVVNDKEYFLRSNGTKTSMIERYLGQEKVLFTISDIWYVWGSSTTYWTKSYAKLSYYDGMFYFNGNKKMYAVQPGKTNPTTVYTYSKNDGYIYGSLVCAGKIYMGIGTNPNPGYPLKLVTASLPDKAIKSVSATASPQTLTFGYTSGSKLQASVTIGSGYSGTPTYQWYQVVNGTEKAISGATKSSYTVPTGLAVGEHTYRVKATLSGYSKSADVKVTVQKKNGVISNKNYVLTYAYSGKSITAPAASNFTTDAGTLSFEWYQSGTKMNSAPVNAGSYVLRVKASGNSNVNAVSQDFAVTVNKKAVTIIANGQNVTYGTAIKSDTTVVTVTGLISGHTLSSISLKPSITTVGTGTITASQAVIKSGSTDVTANYNPQYITGTLVVKKATPVVKFKTTSVMAAYTGKPVTIQAPTVTLVAGEKYSGLINYSYKGAGATAWMRGLPTDLGEYTVKASIPASTNYNAAESNEITLTVTNAPIAENDTIYRIKGKDRYETSFQVAKALKAELGVDRFNTVVVACGTNFADALAGSYLAAKTNAPILMANEGNPSQLAQFVSANLVKGGKIYILGGTGAVSEKIENALRPYGNVKRLKGKSRYETNLEILKEAGVTRDDILVCTGTGFADSLSASALGKPILLVGKSLTQEQKTYLNGLTGNHYYVIGGSAAVSTTVENEIRQYDKAVKRLSGKNRYLTSVYVADEFFNQPYEAVLAYAMNFPDGLSGGPLAMSKNAPLILTATDSYTVAATYARDYKITQGAVLGGDKLISDSAVKKIFNVSKVKIWE